MRSTIIKIVVSVVALMLLAVRPQHTDILKSDPTTACLLALAILPWLSVSPSTRSRHFSMSFAVFVPSALSMDSSKGASGP
jgi:hypothetical protein